MISFALTDDQQMVQDTVRKFAAEELRPKLRLDPAAAGDEDSIPEVSVVMDEDPS